MTTGDDMMMMPERDVRDLARLRDNETVAAAQRHLAVNAPAAAIPGAVSSAVAGLGAVLGTLGLGTATADPRAAQGPVIVSLTVPQALSLTTRLGTGGLLG